MANNEVRIIGGQWKGRKLKFPATGGLRPTLGRVRETLFNWLAPEIHDAHCLDLFAGSGALGFEALSRGAAEVTFVEQDRKASEALKASAQMLSANARIRRTTAVRYLADNSATYDLIFFDPPFSDNGAWNLLPILLSRHLKSAGLLYLETSKHTELPFAGNIVKQSSAGDCRFALYRGKEYRGKEYRGNEYQGEEHQGGDPGTGQPPCQV